MAFEHTDQQPTCDVACGPDTEMCSGHYLPPDPSINMARRVAIALFENAGLEFTQELLDRCIEAPINKAMGDTEFSQLDIESQEAYLQCLIATEFVDWRSRVFYSGRGKEIAEAQIKRMRALFEANEVISHFAVKWHKSRNCFFKPDGRLEGYFRRSVNYYLLDEWRRGCGRGSKRREKHSFIPCLHERISPDTVDELVERRESRITVRTALVSLPKIQRQIVELWMESTSLCEIRKKLHIGQDKLNRLLETAFSTLQGKLANLK